MLFSLQRPAFRPPDPQGGVKNVWQILPGQRAGWREFADSVRCIQGQRSNSNRSVIFLRLKLGALTVYYIW